MVKALILAAGEGRGLHALTIDRPKPMLPVGGRPLLEQIVLLLKAHGIVDIAINLHYRPGPIIEYLGIGEYLGVHIHYSYEEKLLGSAGAARRLKEYLQDSPFVVFCGDLYTDLNVSALLSAHNHSSALATVALTEVEASAACDVFVELDEQQYVRRFAHQPCPDGACSGLATAGVMVAEPALLDWIPPEARLDFGQDIFPQMLASGTPIRGYCVREMLIDIGTPEDYRRAQQAAVARTACLAA